MITIWLLGTGSGERRGRGHRSPPVPGARLQRDSCLPVTHPPTPGQPAVTLHCRIEWQMVLSLEGRGTGSGPPAGLCETVRADGLRWSPDMRCQTSRSALWCGPGQAPPWVEMRELRPNSLKTKRILTSRVTEAELEGTLGVSQVKFIIAERGQGQRDELDLVKVTQLTHDQATSQGPSYELARSSG